MPGFIPPKVSAVRVPLPPVAGRAVDPRDRGSPKWLTRLIRGIGLSLYGFGVTLFGSAAVYCADTWHAAPEWSVTVTFGITILGFGAFAAGVWLLTTPDEGPPLDTKYLRAANVVRWFLAASCFAVAAAIVQRLIFGGTEKAPTRLLALVILGFISTIGFATGLNYLRHLSRRLGEPELRRNADALMIRVGIPLMFAAVDELIATVFQKRGIVMNDALIQLRSMLRFLSGIGVLVMTVFAVATLESFDRKLRKRRSLIRSR